MAEQASITGGQGIWNVTVGNWDEALCGRFWKVPHIRLSMGLALKSRSLLMRFRRFFAATDARDFLSPGLHLGNIVQWRELPPRSVLRPTAHPSASRPPFGRQPTNCAATSTPLNTTTSS